MASATLNLRWPTSAPPQSWHLLEHDQSLPERQIQHQHHQTKSEANGKRNSVWLRSHRRKSICQWPGSDSHMHRCLCSLCTHLWFMDLSPPLAQPPLSHHNHHHPPLSPPTLSQPPQLTKASFSHLPLSVPTTHITHSGNIWALLCLALACCSSWTSNMRQEKQLFSKQLASVSPIGIMWFFSDRFVIVRDSFGLSFGTPGWIKAKQWFWKTLLSKILNAFPEQNLKLPRRTKSTNSKRNIGKSGI